jgi:glycerol-3-phosphate dehydrogenase
MLSIYGGKLTTYRRLAEHALDELAPFLPPMKPSWTAAAALPGGDLNGQDIAAWSQALARRYRGVPADVVQGIARRHGSLATAILDDATSAADLGDDFGNGLTGVEIDYLIREEWARTVDDVLWRRTKCGLGMADASCKRVAAHMVKALADNGMVQPAHG